MHAHCRREWAEIKLSSMLGTTSLYLYDERMLLPATWASPPRNRWENQSVLGTVLCWQPSECAELPTTSSMWDLCTSVQTCFCTAGLWRNAPTMSLHLCNILILRGTTSDSHPRFLHISVFFLIPFPFCYLPLLPIVRKRAYERVRNLNK